MLCDDLRDEKSDLAHPLVCDRIASGLISILLASIPHKKTRVFEDATRPLAPYFLRRVEQFIEEHARDAISLAAKAKPVKSCAAGCRGIETRRVTAPTTGRLRQGVVITG
jgi:hypothetical protein